MISGRLGITGFVLIVLGAKLALIAAYGSATPFWDQWDGEAETLFRPYLTGTLDAAQLLAFHNEHRLLFPRLFELGLFKMSGRWDPILEMIAGAAVHAAALGAAVAMLAAPLGALARLVLCLFGALIFAIPFGWENTLSGFQAQFYLLLLFAFLSLHLLFDAPAWSARWWLGTLLAVAAYFSMASGAQTLAPVIAIALLQTATGLRPRTRRQSLAVLAHLLLLFVMVADSLSAGVPSPLKATSIGDFLASLFTAAGWPIVTLDWSIAGRLVASLLINGPLFLLTLGVLARCPPASDRRWFYLAMGLWAALQIVAIAFGRASSIWTSRYFDLFAISLLVNAACLILLARTGGPIRVIIGCLTAIWLCAVLVGTVQKGMEKLPAELAWKRAVTTAETENLMNFLATGDFANLRDKPPFQIPFPSAERLRDIVSDPTVRAILPPRLFRKQEPDTFDAVALKNGPVLIAIGLALLILALIRRARGGTRSASPE